MNLTAILSNIDIKESICMHWVIDYLDADNPANQNDRDRIEEHIFNEANMLYMVENYDFHLLNRLFPTVSAGRFRGVFDRLLKMWRTPGFPHRRSLSPVLKAIDPETTLKMVLDSYQADSSEPERWVEYFDTLILYPPEESEATITPMIDRHVSNSAGLSPLEHKTLVAHICFYRDNNHVELVNDYLLDSFVTVGDPHGLSWFLSYVGFPDEVFNRILFIIYHDEDPDFFLPPELFEQEVSMDEINGIINEIRDAGSDRLKAFFQKYRTQVNDLFLRTLLSLFLQADQDDFEDIDDWMEILGMILSILIYTLLKEKPDFAILPEERVFEIMGTGDVASLYQDEIAERLASFEKEKVMKAIRDIMFGNPDRVTLEGILHVVGKLAYPELIPDVMGVLGDINVLDEEFEDPVALMHSFGEPMGEYLMEQFPELPESRRVDALVYFTGTGGDKAVEFLDRYFESIPMDEMEYALPLCEKVVYEKALDWLRERLVKNYPEIRRAFLTLSLLTGKRDELVEKHLADYRQKEKETSDLLDRMSFDSAIERNVCSLDLDLKCRHCGESKIYEVKNILVYSSDYDPYIAEEIECYHCHSLSDFELTTKSRMYISMEIARQGIFRDQKDDDDNPPESPVKIIGGITAFGKEMSLPDAIKKYETKIRNDHRDPVVRFCLGNIYANTNQPGKAIPLYEEAIELDPAYLQPYVSLAEFEEDRGDYQKALDYLEQGRKYLDSWKYHQVDKATRAEFAEYYREFHLRLLQEIRSDIAPILKNDIMPDSTISKSPKIGRNAPCPCGSGKKYKKCCLVK